MVLILGLRIIHWAYGSSSTPFISFFPSGVTVLATIGSLLPCTLLSEFSSVVICKYWVHVILNMKSHVMHFIQVALYCHGSRRSVRSMSGVSWTWKLFKNFFMYVWLCTPGVWPVQLCTSTCGHWAIELYIMFYFFKVPILYGYKPGFGLMLGKTLSILVQKILVLAFLALWGLGSLHFHKYVGSLVNKIAKCNQNKISKRQGA